MHSKITISIDELLLKNISQLVNRGLFENKSKFFQVSAEKELKELALEKWLADTEKNIKETSALTVKKHGKFSSREILAQVWEAE